MINKILLATMIPVPVIILLIGSQGIMQNKALGQNVTRPSSQEIKTSSSQARQGATYAKQLGELANACSLALKVRPDTTILTECGNIFGEFNDRMAVLFSQMNLTQKAIIDHIQYGTPLLP